MRGISAACLVAQIFVLALPLSAQNRLNNPDLNQDSIGWTSTFGSAGWFDLDADECYNGGASGGLRMVSATLGANQFFRAQSDCFAVTPGEDMCREMEYIDGGAALNLLTTYYLDELCTSGTQTQDAWSGLPSPGAFIRLSYCAVVPLGYHGARLMSESITFNTATPFSMVADRYYAGTGIRIFGDDFEASDTCRWDLLPPLSLKRRSESAGR